ncbi:MAG TPA: ABC transporter permease [Trebonia sp.]|nr:ABC transporter permease [Trebonia sp.]
MIETAPPPAQASCEPARSSPRLPNPVSLLGGQVRYQARLLLAGTNALAIGVGLPVILLVVSNARRSQLGAADIAGYAVFGLTVTAWNTHGVSLVAAREAGILKRWRATPLPRWCYLSGRIITTALIGVMSAAVTILAGVLFYGTRLTAEAIFCALVALLLGAFAWAAAATAVTGIVRGVEAAGPTFILIYFPVIVLSGVLGSVQLPHWLTTLASYLPAEPLTGAVTSSLRHAPGAPLLPAHDLAVLATWAIAGILAAVVLFRWEPSRPVQRRAARATR